MRAAVFSLSLSSALHLSSVPSLYCLTGEQLLTVMTLNSRYCLFTVGGQSAIAGERYRDTVILVKRGRVMSLLLPAIRAMCRGDGCSDISLTV